MKQSNIIYLQPQGQLYRQAKRLPVPVDPAMKQTPIKWWEFITQQLVEPITIPNDKAAIDRNKVFKISGWTDII